MSQVVRPPVPAIITLMDPHQPTVSIIVPTYKESANLRPLIERIFAATGARGIKAELIIVDDDSRDGTDEILQKLAEQHPVRLIVRTHQRGLSSAVLAGFAESRGEKLVVLDADLQHPPEAIPDLLARLDENNCDFVLATRYTGGGGIDREWPWSRRLASRIASFLARPLTPLSDPMSGYFALPRTTWQRAEGLSPIGYKIGLELFVKARCQKPAEVPITFDTRQAGRSKASAVEFVRYLRHLARLYHFRFPWLIPVGVMLLLVAVIAIWFL